MESRLVALIIAALLNALLILTTIALFVYRGHRELLISPNAILLTSVGATAAFLCNEISLLQTILNGEFPCFIGLWVQYIGLT
ncbi:hypothetical protein BJ085DRAFT_39297, partial [Dimargaris cristalligena]